jgi:imidazolonepropionase
MHADRVWCDARLMTMRGGDLGIVAPGLVAASNGRIVYAGPAADAPAFDAPASDGPQIIGCDGRWVTPGLIDCHTHLVFGGDRAAEWQARLAGASYADLAAIGGIRATVAATRAADEAQLLRATLGRLDCLIADGVTTVEVKSGYGLDLPTELRQLRVAGALSEHRPIRIAATLLAAHAVPHGMTADEFIDTVALPLIDQVAARRLADAVDGFLETIAFGPDQIARVFARATERGLRVKLHADQLSDGGGAALAARSGALSADHLEYASEAGVAAMAAAGTVAVLLPGAFLTLGETRRPPVAAMRAHGVSVAVATDCNPGSSPLVSLLATLSLAANLFGLTVEECLRGATCNAARALGLGADRGQLAPGLRADLAIWSIEQPADLLYWIGARPLWRREFGA